MDHPTRNNGFFLYQVEKIVKICSFLKDKSFLSGFFKILLIITNSGTAEGPPLKMKPF